MPNHVHVVVTPPDAGALPLFVKLAAQRYAQLRNKERDSSGKLFEQRYWSTPIRDERQLAATTMYVDLNAPRAGLVEDPADYRWTSFAIHSGQPRRASIPPGLWTPSPWYLALGASYAERSANYLIAIANYRATSTHDYPEYNPADFDPSLEEYLHRLRRPDNTSAL